ncbi:hypothetical protein BaRGS_00010482 [Batillaria attramentaria]|uniref:Uncharacterized protein n=1 Tax=Batillaria attramentaria TaxID=370345 RepID=A0ABD0LGQ0_9CAEN
MPVRLSLCLGVFFVSTGAQSAPQSPQYAPVRSSQSALPPSDRCKLHPGSTINYVNNLSVYNNGAAVGEVARKSIK